MKIREGFVSNSSTASFIVKYYEFFSKDKKPLLTKAVVNKLVKFGFWKSWASYPEQVNYTEHKEKPIEDDNFISYVFENICNELDTIEWLVKHNIPFEADCHYGQYTLTFEKDATIVKVYKNLGKLALMHGIIKNPKKEKCYDEIPIENIGDGYFI